MEKLYAVSKNKTGHRCFLGARVVRWKNWKSGGQRKGNRSRLGVGWEVGVEESWAKTSSLRN